MQIEIPQELADRFASRFVGASVEEYVVRAVREAIDEGSPAGECWMASQAAADRFYEED